MVRKGVDGSGPTEGRAYGRLAAPVLPRDLGSADRARGVGRRSRR